MWWKIAGKPRGKSELADYATDAKSVALIVVILGVDGARIVVHIVRVISGTRCSRPEVAVRPLIVLARVVPIPVAVVLSETGPNNSSGVREGAA